MKIVLKFIITSLCCFSGMVSAEQVETKYACKAGGCEIVCKGKSSDMQLKEEAMLSVITVHHDNGNVELFLNSGALGKQTLVISPENLFCKITNYK